MGNLHKSDFVLHRPGDRDLEQKSLAVPDNLSRSRRPMSYLLSSILSAPGVAVGSFTYSVRFLEQDLCNLCPASAGSSFCSAHLHENITRWKSPEGNTMVDLRSCAAVCTLVRRRAEQHNTERSIDRSSCGVSAVPHLLSENPSEKRAHRAEQPGWRGGRLTSGQLTGSVGDPP